MLSQQILQKNKVMPDDVNGVYLMANNSNLTGKPILTFQMKNNGLVKVKLNKDEVTPMLCFLAEKNVPFLNVNSPKRVIDIEILTKGYNYFFFSVSGGKLKELTRDLNKIGIDASIGCWKEN